MSEHLVNLQPAYVLHSRKFRESSLILDLLTQDYGKVILLAKGVRKANSKQAGILQCFKPMCVSYSGRNDLKTLIAADLNSGLTELKGLGLYCGFYLNELVKNFLYPYDPHPEVFYEYQAALKNLLRTDKVEITLRLFELKLLEHLGYGLPLNYDYQSGLALASEKFYQIEIEHGFYEHESGPYSGAMLLALKSGNLVNKTQLKQAKLLLRYVIDMHLNFKKIHSRDLIKQHMKYTS